VPHSVSATAGKSKYYWRGFLSPVGSARPKNSHAAYMQTHRGGGGGKMRGFPANMGQARDNRSRPPNHRKNFSEKIEVSNLLIRNLLIRISFPSFFPLFNAKRQRVFFYVS
jgi:hypothetical protein